MLCVLKNIKVSQVSCCVDLSLMQGITPNAYQESQLPSIRIIDFMQIMHIRIFPPQWDMAGNLQMTTPLIMNGIVAAFSPNN